MKLPPKITNRRTATMEVGKKRPTFNLFGHGKTRKLAAENDDEDEKTPTWVWLALLGAAGVAGYAWIRNNPQRAHVALQSLGLDSDNPARRLVDYIGQGRDPTPEQQDEVQQDPAAGVAAAAAGVPMPDTDGLEPSTDLMVRQSIVADQSGEPDSFSFWQDFPDLSSLPEGQRESAARGWLQDRQEAFQFWGQGKYSGWDDAKIQAEWERRDDDPMPGSRWGGEGDRAMAESIVDIESEFAELAASGMPNIRVGNDGEGGFDLNRELMRSAAASASMHNRELLPRSTNMGRVWSGYYSEVQGLGLKPELVMQGLIFNPEHPEAQELFKRLKAAYVADTAAAAQQRGGTESSGMRQARELVQRDGLPTTYEDALQWIDQPGSSEVLGSLLRHGQDHYAEVSAEARMANNRATRVREVRARLADAAPGRAHSSAFADWVDFPLELVLGGRGGMLGPMFLGTVYNDTTSNPVMDRDAVLEDSGEDLFARDFMHDHLDMVSEARTLEEQGQTGQARARVQEFLNQRYPDAPSLAAAYESMNAEGEFHQNMALQGSALVSRNIPNPIAAMAGMSALFTVGGEAIRFGRSSRAREEFNPWRLAQDTASNAAQMGMQYGGAVQWWRSLDPHAKALIAHDPSGTGFRAMTADLIRDIKRTPEMVRNSARTLVAPEGMSRSLGTGARDFGRYATSRLGAGLDSWNAMRDFVSRQRTRTANAARWAAGRPLTEVPEAASRPPPRYTPSAANFNMATPLSERFGFRWAGHLGRRSSSAFNTLGHAARREAQAAYQVLQRRLPGVAGAIDRGRQAVQAARASRLGGGAARLARSGFTAMSGLRAFARNTAVATILMEGGRGAFEIGHFMFDRDSYEDATTRKIARASAARLASEYDTASDVISRWGTGFMSPREETWYRWGRLNYVENAGNPTTIAGQGFKDGLNGLFRMQAMSTAFNEARDMVRNDPMFNALPPHMQAEAAEVVGGTILARLEKDGFDVVPKGWIHPDVVGNRLDTVTQRVRSRAWQGVDPNDPSQQRYRHPRAVASILGEDLYTEMTAVATSNNAEQLYQRTMEALNQHPHYRHLPLAERRRVAEVGAERYRAQMYSAMDQFHQSGGTDFRAFDQANEAARRMERVTQQGEAAGEDSKLSADEIQTQLDEALGFVVGENVVSELQSTEVEKDLWRLSGGQSAAERLESFYPSDEEIARAGGNVELARVRRHNDRLDAIRAIDPDLVQRMPEGDTTFGGDARWYRSRLPGIRVEESWSPSTAFSEARQVSEMRLEQQRERAGVGPTIDNEAEAQQFREYLTNQANEAGGGWRHDEYALRGGLWRLANDPRILGTDQWGMGRNGEPVLDPEARRAMRGYLSPSRMQRLMGEYAVASGDFDTTEAPGAYERGYRDSSGTFHRVGWHDPIPDGRQAEYRGRNPLWGAAESAFSSTPSYLTFNPETGEYDQHYGEQPPEVQPGQQVERGGIWTVNPSTGRLVRMDPASVVQGGQASTSITDPALYSAWLERAMQERPEFFATRGGNYQDRFRQNVAGVARQIAYEQGQMVSPYEEAKPFILNQHGHPVFEVGGEPVSWEQVYAQARSQPESWRGFMPEGLRGQREAHPALAHMQNIDRAQYPLFRDYWESRGGQEAYQSWAPTAQVTQPAPAAPVQPRPAVPTTPISTSSTPIRVDSGIDSIGSPSPRMGGHVAIMAP